MKEALGGDMGGDMTIARLGVAHVRSPRDAWSLNYLGRTFANDADMFNPAATERSHALLVGYARAIGVGTDVNVRWPRTRRMAP
jgi:hypothetical protein